MLIEEIKKYFGQQNFLLGNTSVAGITLMKNTNDGEDIFIVLLDNSEGQIYTTGAINSINIQLKNMTQPPKTCDILFLAMTNNPGRDKLLAQVDNAKVWLVDTNEKRLIIYENQPDDFYGFKYGLELTIEKSGVPGGPFNIKAQIKNKNFSYVTVILIAVNVIWFIVLCCLGDISDPEFMWSMGASFGYSVFEKYQFYRLVTSMFMHFGVMHLVGNMIYLAIAGNLVEKAAGHLRFFLIYMLSGIAASLISTAYYYFGGNNTICAGASGAIYGLIGAVIYLTAVNRGRIGTRQMFIRVFVIVAFLIYSNLTNIGTGTDVVAHIAGLIFGIILSLGFLGTGKSRKNNYRK